MNFNLIKIMETLRTQEELWKIVKEKFDDYFIYGLCGVIWNLISNDFISGEEHLLLVSELKKYNEANGSWNYFLGEKGDPKPRKEFIEKMIKKHKNIL